jgi:DNA primase
LAIFIPEDKISEIKNTADIVDIISDSVLLNKKGRNHVGLCPFHSEKTPSFTVNSEKQIFHCFGCGTGGNVFNFLMKQEGLTFPEAVRTLAKRYGIDIPTRTLSLEQRRTISQKERLLEINKLALKFFRHALTETVAGQRALSYLNGRGFAGDIIDQFYLGYAPKGWDNLLRYSAKKGVSPSHLESAGLVAARKNSPGFYDRFRDRIIFPIIDINKNVVGFGGRVMDDSEPKYLNSPETPVYNKSKTLYGLDRAKGKCRSEKCVYIVEGYLDLLALHQHGIENSAATLGTALTVDHVRLMTRYAQRMILVYDSDEAGIRSAQRCIETFWKEHVNFQRRDVFREEKADTHILVLPDGHDPDSFLFEFGSETFLRSAARAPGIITFLMQRAIARHGLSTEGKIRIVADLQSPLAAINDRVARSIYVKQLAERLEIDESALLDKVREIHSQAEPRKKASETDSVDEKLPVSRSGNLLEKRIIAMMLQYRQSRAEIEGQHVLDYFQSDTLKDIGHTILKHDMSFEGDISEFLNKIDDSKKRRTIAALAMTDEPWNEKGCRMLINQFIETAQRQQQNQVLVEKIKAAELHKDQAVVFKLLKDKQKQAIRNAKQKQALLNDK